MELSVQDNSFLDSFDLLKSQNLDDYGKDKLNLFMIRINANEFDYNFLVDKLGDSVITYSVTRKIKEEYTKHPWQLVRKALSHFVQYNRNDGELGELLLYAFLECHLNAPKILTKLELKTSSSMYVNGSDGVHYLKLPNGNYQLIFGESKLNKSITDAICDAFVSIQNFKNEVNKKGGEKSGITYEKSLISDNLSKESFSSDDIDFIKSIIYPRRNNTFRVDDAFGIFVGYEMTIPEAMKKKPNDLFNEEIKGIIVNEIDKRIDNILRQIDSRGLSGHSFYIYILPFTNLDNVRKSIMKKILMIGEG